MPGFPDGLGIVDTMIGFADRAHMRDTYAFVWRQTKDRESKENFEFPVEYMFKDVPESVLETDDTVGLTVSEMDRFGIERGMIGVGEGPGGGGGAGAGAGGGGTAPGESEGLGEEALRRYPDRFIPAAGCDPNAGMDGIRRLVRLHETYGIRAVHAFPAGTLPQVAINDKKMYPIYAKCVELGVPIFCCAGVPGPRLRMEPQRVELIDEVMYDFPDLIFVTRHGCEPWTDLAVKLMLKWPGLHYSTSAFAPKYYPRDVIDYANTRGADKLIYAGYFPMGLSLERIMTELRDLPLRDHVWSKFLRENALRVLGLQ